MIWDVIIVGGGPAGLAAAMMLQDKNVLLIEKNNQLGSKILISGAGQCNLTHAGDIKDYANNYGLKWRFVRDSLMKFTNNDFMKMMQSNDLNLVELDNGKVFPASLKAQDVVDTFKRICHNTKINLNESVMTINKMDYWSVKTNKSSYQTQHLMIATGGLTYPTTGSTGDGYKFARALNVDVVEPRFALAPVYIKDFSMASIKGLSFQSIQIDHYRSKKIATIQGDLLITHFGLSGPVILNNSRTFRNGDVLKVNFTNFEKQETLNEALLAKMSLSPKKSVKNILIDGFMTSRLAEHLIGELGFDEQQKSSDLKKVDRKRLVQAMFAYEFVIAQVGKAHIAMVTAGGISTQAINKKTFAVKAETTLYFVGECVDVDGDTGGYNIQFAVSSGVAAARNILEVFND